MELPQNSYRISIISSCNMKCEYCHNEGNKTVNMLSKVDIENLIKNSFDFNIKSVRLTGGEPLIHPEIIEICKMLTEKYKLKVGINTNCIEIEKIKEIVKNGWCSRVVVGLDFFDSPVSKKSPVGVSSQEILSNIIELKNLGCDVSISKVYVNDEINTMRLVEWSINNSIRIKIIEVIKNERFNATSEEFIKIRNKIIKEYNMEIKKDQFNEVSGYINNNRVITFFHSHCRVGECDICKKIHLRVTSTGKLKQCMYTELDDIDFKIGNVHDNIEKYLARPAKFY